MFLPPTGQPWEAATANKMWHINSGRWTYLVVVSARTVLLCPVQGIEPEPDESCQVAYELALIFAE